MTTHPYLDPSGCLILDNSALALYKTCPTMARYKLIEKRDRVGTAIQRDAGKALHSALEVRYKMSGGSAPSPAVRDSMTAAVAKGYEKLELGDDDYLTQKRMLEVVAAYNDGVRFEMGVNGKNGVYEFAGYGQEPFEVLGVEVPFAVRLGEVLDHQHQQVVPIIFMGRSDLLVRWLDRGEITVMDHKSMNRWNANKTIEWRMAAGPKGYASCIPQWALEGIDTLPQSIRRFLEPSEGLREAIKKQVSRVDGFCLNAIAISKMPESMSRVKSPPLAFHRELVFYTDQQLDEWRQDTLRWCETWLRWCAAGQWPLNEKHCASFYGRTCPYYEVCSLPPEQRALALSTDLYKEAKWHPLDRSTDETADTSLDAAGNTLDTTNLPNLK